VARERSRIDLLARAVADGKTVDWTAALESASTDDERRAIEELRAIEGLARRPDALARNFTTTEWSLVLTAGREDDPESRRALESLCRRYWYPVYAEVRFAGHDAERARDRTLKRGGHATTVSLDFEVAERQYASELAHRRTPEAVFDRVWARALLEQVLRRLRDEMEKGHSLDRYERLAPLLTGSDRTIRYRELAAQWDTTEAAIKMAVYRLRRRLRSLLREEVAHTMRDPEEVDEEIRFLRSVAEGG
jgi:RNA polymerase sigma-70 factor (ECF subfamily)